MKLLIRDKVKYEIIHFLLKILALLPQKCLRYLGSFVGILMPIFSKRTITKLQHNLVLTGVCTKDTVPGLSRAVARHFGMVLMETVCTAWQRSKHYNFKLCRKTNGFAVVEDACANGLPILFLTPHVGNFEIILKRTAYVLKKKFTVLYKADKNKWWNQLMLEGRTEDNITPVATDKKGVLAILKALKNKEVVGILPDSIASQGDGVWVDFLGQRVFATTLAAKLSLMPLVKTFIVACYRNDDGFEANYIPFTANSNDIVATVQQIYLVIEEIVKKNPEQFYWSYDRFRVPEHAPVDNKCHGI